MFEYMLEYNKILDKFCNLSLYKLKVFFFKNPSFSPFTFN